MCGIFLCLGHCPLNVKEVLKKLKPRGPNSFGVYQNNNIIVAHTRLAIVNPCAGPQPLINDNWVLTINGEIYNPSTELNEHETDCSTILKHLTSNSNQKEWLQQINGMFSFAAYNRSTKQIFVTRDAIGITPLYIATTTQHVIVSSLISVFPDECEVHSVEPGTLYVYDINGLISKTVWKQPYTLQQPIPLEQINTQLYKCLKESVERRVMLCDVPWGVLLSGGLDSSIVAALANLCHRKDYPVLHTFCIGLDDSPDLIAAQEVADFIKSYHHSFTYTIEEGLKCLTDVIKAIETYDVTTVRASIPMFILGKKIKQFGIKMILSGEGSDELFGGYLYNWFCPSPQEMHNECTDKLNQLWGYDCLRANKTMGAHGIETRVPFLDPNVIDLAMRKIDPTQKMSHTHPDGKKPEKWLLRETFSNLLPTNILKRTKAQFSDAVGNKWIDALKTEAKQLYPNEQHPEATWYKSIFDKHFTMNTTSAILYTPHTIACSTKRAIEWNNWSHIDPSANNPSFTTI